MLRAIEPEPLELDWQRELRELYDELDREVASLGPVCELSGRCCRFLEYGHTLFVSTAEVEFLLERGPGPAATARSRGDLPVAGFARALHGPRRPAARLPGLLLRPVVRGGIASAFGAIHRSARRGCPTSTRSPWNYAPLHRHLHRRAEQGGSRRSSPLSTARRLTGILLDTTLSHQYT